MNSYTLFFAILVVARRATHYSLTMNGMEKILSANVKVFVAFARKRLGDQHIAEDVVQDSMLKAIKATRVPKSESEAMVWFYRILRRSIIDIYRRNETRKRFVEKLEQSLPENVSPEDRSEICRCYKRLLPLLPAANRVLLERIDLEGETPAEVAKSLGLSANALHVRLHRARKSLRAELVKTCRACSRHGCLDCTCG